MAAASAVGLLSFFDRGGDSLVGTLGDDARGVPGVNAELTDVVLRVDDSRLSIDHLDHARHYQGRVVLSLVIPNSNNCVRRHGGIV